MNFRQFNYDDIVSDKCSLHKYNGSFEYKKKCFFSSKILNRNEKSETITQKLRLENYYKIYI